jgi:hypothetical protein
MEVLIVQRLLGKALAALLVLGLVAAASAGAASLITGADIKNGTVTGKDIKQRSVKLGDLSDKAKDALAGVPGPMGAVGPAGPQGPDGPQGEPGTADRFAELHADGTLSDDLQKNVAQDQISHDTDTGIYCFTFPGDGGTPVAGAANGVIGDVFATLQIEEQGGITGCPDGATVRVVTYDLSEGAPADRVFRLILEYA